LLLIILHLIDALEDKQIWAEKSDGKFIELFKMQTQG